MCLKQSIIEKTLMVLAYCMKKQLFGHSHFVCYLQSLNFKGKGKKKESKG